MTANLPFGKQVLVFRQHQLFKAIIQRFLRFLTERMIMGNMSKKLLHLDIADPVTGQLYSTTLIPPKK